MFKVHEKYTDYNGVEREEDFYFNLTTAEMMKLEYNTTGGLSEKIKKIAAAKDTTEIMNTFEEFLQLSYGQKSDDGKRFIKSPELLKEFMETPAYSQIYMRLGLDEKMAIDFINHVVPADILAQANIANNKVVPIK